ncbi:MAG: phosphate ABC transporter permease subunit PstC [Actinomycetota bacterium]
MAESTVTIGTTGREPIALSNLRGSRSRRRKEAAIRALFLSAAGLSVVINVAILLSLGDGTIDFLRKADLSTLWSEGWFPRRGLFDVKTILVGTLLVSVIAMAVATPLALGAAIYLSEYASRRARRILKPILEVLAGVPSVVMAYFALTWISPNIVKSLVLTAPSFNLAAAGIGVGILIVPIVASVAEDALHAVPESLREASYGLAARKRATSLRVVVPAAVSGIVAALILGISRAIGETLVVAIAAGATGGSLFTLDIFGPGQTMTGAMASLATGSDQVRGAEAAYPSLFFVGTLLFFLTLGLNIVSERFVRRVRRRY